MCFTTQCVLQDALKATEAEDLRHILDPEDNDEAIDIATFRDRILRFIKNR